MTIAAGFSVWEERRAKYLAYGGTTGTGYTTPSSGALPGMSTYAPFTQIYIGMAKTDPRGGVVYPNPFRTLSTRNATYEPTAAEWPEYALLNRSRYQAAANGFAVVDLGSGQIVMRNKLDLAIPDFDGTGAGIVGGCPYATVMLPSSVSGDESLYLIAVLELNTPRALTNGVPVAGDTFSATNFVIEFL